MKFSFIAVLAAIAALVAAMSAVAHVSSPPAGSTSSGASALLKLPRLTPAGQETLFGHIKSLTRTDGRWEMRFDPALLLHGVTAGRAALEDTGSSDVPNDSYTLELGHRLLTYVVAANAPVTVLTKGLGETQISVPELAQIVKGKSLKNRPLFDRMNGLGYWIRVGDKYPNSVLSLDQQYHP
jgi:hypothetical protein